MVSTPAVISASKPSSVKSVVNGPNEIHLPSVIVPPPVPKLEASSLPPPQPPPPLPPLPPPPPPPSSLPTLQDRVAPPSAVRMGDVVYLPVFKLSGSTSTPPPQSLTHTHAAAASLPPPQSVIPPAVIKEIMHKSIRSHQYIDENNNTNTTKPLDLSAKPLVSKPSHDHSDNDQRSNDLENSNNMPLDLSFKSDRIAAKKTPERYGNFTSNPNFII